MMHLLMFLLKPAHNRSLAPALTHEIYIPAGFPNPFHCQSFRWDEAGWVAPSWQLTPAPWLEKVWQKKMDGVGCAQDEGFFCWTGDEFDVDVSIIG